MENLVDLGDDADVDAVAKGSHGDSAGSHGDNANVSLVDTDPFDLFGSNVCVGLQL